MISKLLTATLLLAVVACDSETPHSGDSLDSDSGQEMPPPSVAIDGSPAPDATTVVSDAGQTEPDAALAAETDAAHGLVSPERFFGDTDYSCCWLDPSIALRQTTEQCEALCADHPGTVTVARRLGDLSLVTCAPDVGQCDPFWYGDGGE